MKKAASMFLIVGGDVYYRMHKPVYCIPKNDNNPVIYVNSEYYKLKKDFYVWPASAWPAVERFYNRMVVDLGRRDLVGTQKQWIDVYDVV